MFTEWGLPDHLAADCDSTYRDNLSQLPTSPSDERRSGLRVTSMHPLPHSVPVFDSAIT